MKDGVLLWLFITNPVCEYLRRPIPAMAIPIASSFYIGVYELLGDRFSFFKHHPGIAAALTFIALSAIAIVSLLKGVAALYQERAMDKFIAVLTNLVFANGKIVDAKLNRFKNNAANISNSGKGTFLQITKPKEQIEVICGEIAHYLKESYDIHSLDSIRITILQKSPLAGNYDWVLHTDSQPNLRPKPGTAASAIIRSGSVIEHCINTGEVKFVADKQASAERGEYLVSQRDERKGNGSLFCYPCSIDVAGKISEFAVSITTYNDCLITPIFYGDSIDRAEKMLAEFCKRIELELTLQCLKYWENKNTQEPRNRRSTDE